MFLLPEFFGLRSGSSVGTPGGPQDPIGWGCAQTYPQCYTVLAADLYQFCFERGQIKVDMRTSGSELVPTLTPKQDICQASQRKA